DTILYSETAMDNLRLFGENIRVVKFFKLAFCYARHGYFSFKASLASGEKKEAIKVNNYERALINEIIFSPKFTANYLELNNYYESINMPSSRKNLFWYAIMANPKKDWPYDFLGMIYLREGNTAKADEVYSRAIRLNSKKHWLNRILGKRYEQSGDFNEAKRMYQKSIELAPNEADIFGAHIVLARFYQRIKDFEQAKTIYLDLADKYKTRDLTEVFTGLAACFRNLGEIDRAIEYEEKLKSISKKAEEDLQFEYFRPTRVNYFKLADIVKLFRMKLICVQYPMRELKPLKEMLREKEVWGFVDNQASFMEKVKKEGFSAYFTDKFGGNFGHCTPEGYRILAENVGKVILDKLAGK
ncbi:MAG: hypothetical protein HQL27_03985, partial [Candidatus Omnitrophica bacterium]|nr:hypothetical protein [Candidatus Omnitrophota bacterium]